MYNYKIAETAREIKSTFWSGKHLAAIAFMLFSNKHNFLDPYQTNVPCNVYTLQIYFLPWFYTKVHSPNVQEIIYPEDTGYETAIFEIC